MDRRVLSTVVIAFLALAGFVIARNDLVVGSITADSVLFLQRSVNKTGVAGQIISENVIYSFRTGNITRIRALDLDSNFTGGFASIVSGGVGYENVTLRFQSSAVGRGYNFFIDIYGR